MRILLLLLAGSALAAAQTAPAIADKTREMAIMAGYFPMYYDFKTGRVLLEVSRWNDDYWVCA
jgi:hypothetical protein